MEAEKKNLLITESQCAYVLKDSFIKANIYFSEIYDCVGIIITMKNQDKWLYHRFSMDSSKDLSNQLKILSYTQPEIEKIELIGGNINKACYPYSSPNNPKKIYELNNDGMKRKIQFDIFDKNQNYIFLNKRFECVDKIFVNQIKTREVLDEKQSTEHTEKMSALIADMSDLSKTFQAECFCRQTEKKEPRYTMYYFNIDSIKDFLGYRNQLICRKKLEKYFPEFKGKIAHRYTPVGQYIKITSDGIEAVKNLEKYATNKKEQFYFKKYEEISDPDSLYNSCEESSDKLKINNVSMSLNTKIKGIKM